MGDDPSPGEYERLLLSMKTTARKELVLLHPDRSVVAGSTREWLKVRYTGSIIGIDTNMNQSSESTLGPPTYPCRAPRMYLEQISKKGGADHCG